MFLFTGADYFLLHQELTRRKKGFIQKYGQESIHEYNKTNRNPSQITMNISGSDLFASKNMIIIHGYPTGSDRNNDLTTNQEDFLGELLPTLPKNDNIIILVSYKPDKRKKSYKRCKKHCEIKTFEPMNIPEAANKAVERSTTTLDASLAKYLISLVGTDSGRLYYESLKIAQYCHYFDKDKATTRLLNTIVYRSIASDPFKMTDVLFSDAIKTITFLGQLQSNNENRNMVLGTLLRSCKTVILYLDCLKKGMTNNKDIASKIKAHPFVISKFNGQKKNLTDMSDQIQTFFAQLLHIEYLIKSGQLPDTAFWGEVKTAIIKMYHT